MFWKFWKLNWYLEAVNKGMAYYGRYLLPHKNLFVSKICLFSVASVDNLWILKNIFERKNKKFWQNHWPCDSNLLKILETVRWCKKKIRKLNTAEGFPLNNIICYCVETEIRIKLVKRLFIFKLNNFLTDFKSYIAGKMSLS